MENKENKINVYQCQECGGKIVTKELDAGVTPFSMSCRALDGCPGLMTSSFKMCPQDLAHGWVWFKPLSVHGLDQWTREHVEKGGLVLERVPADDKGIEDPVFRMIVEVVKTLEWLSATTLQRKFRITYPRAMVIIDKLIEGRYIDMSKDNKGRHVVLLREDPQPNKESEIYQYDR